MRPRVRSPVLWRWGEGDTAAFASDSYATMQYTIVIVIFSPIMQMNAGTPKTERLGPNAKIIIIKKITETDPIGTYNPHGSMKKTGDCQQYLSCILPGVWRVISSLGDLSSVARYVKGQNCNKLV